MITMRTESLNKSNKWKINIADCSQSFKFERMKLFKIRDKLSVNSNRLFNYHHRFNHLRHHFHQSRRFSSHLLHRLVTTRSINIDIQIFETVTSNQNYEIFRTFNHETMIIANRIAFEFVNMILNRTIMLKIFLLLSQMLEIFHETSTSHLNLYRKSLIQKN